MHEVCSVTNQSSVSALISLSSQVVECSVRGSEVTTKCVSVPYSDKMMPTLVRLMWFLFDIKIEGSSLVLSIKERDHGVWRGNVLIQVLTPMKKLSNTAEPYDPEFVRQDGTLRSWVRADTDS